VGVGWELQRHGKEVLSVTGCCQPEPTAMHAMPILMYLLPWTAQKASSAEVHCQPWGFLDLTSPSEALRLDCLHDTASSSTAAYRSSNQQV
jgi:hypothetical protein